MATAQPPLAPHLPRTRCLADFRARSRATSLPCQNRHPLQCAPALRAGRSGCKSRRSTRPASGTSQSARSVAGSGSGAHKWPPDCSRAPGNGHALRPRHGRGDQSGCGKHFSCLSRSFTRLGTIACDRQHAPITVTKNGALTLFVITTNAARPQKRRRRAAIDRSHCHELARGAQTC